MLRLLLVLLSFVLCDAQALAKEVVRGSGRAATEERGVSGFHAIAVSVPGRVTAIQGASEGATLTADDNVLPKIVTVVDAGVLRIRFPHGVDVRPRTPIANTVHGRSLDSFETAGAVTVEVPRLEGKRLDARLAGSGRIVLPELRLGTLSIRSSGHAHGLAIGRVDRFELGMAGSGEMNAARLDAASASVHIAGSATAVVWVRERLEAGITGSGSVRYFGDPGVRSRVAGSGRVRRMGASPP
ncbi:MAG TPA: head GIN domain-containing protein [Usitatibacter sp.]|nr:head GIN domain-containing protein [Usitatibacter sp.]